MERALAGDAAEQHERPGLPLSSPVPADLRRPQVFAEVKMKMQGTTAKSNYTVCLKYQKTKIVCHYMQIIM